MKTLSFLSATAAGVLFGIGLIVSEMVNPVRVKGFLDITGQWDPTLLFVMAGAVAVTFIGYRLVLKKSHPIFENRFSLPDASKIDRKLLLGAALFGAGWGISGFCPGPAIVGAMTLRGEVLIFIVAMLFAMKIFDIILHKPS